MKHHHALMTTTGFVLALSLALFDMWYLGTQRTHNTQADLMQNIPVQESNANINAPK